MSYNQKVDRGYLSFAQGLLTELSPLDTPEEVQGTTSDELNMSVDTDGMVRVRRDGIEFLAELTADVQSYTVLEAKYWKRAGCYVLCCYNSTVNEDDQYEVYTVFMDATDPLLNRAYKSFINAVDFVLPSVCFIRTKCLLTYGGRPMLCTRNESKEYTIEYVNLYIRDFKLINDSLTITERPTSLTDEHKYNLLNAGWYQLRALKSTNLVNDPIADFYTVRTQYPSNSDIAYLGDITDSNGDLKFDPLSFDNINLGSTEAARGHYVFSIREIDRDAKLTARDDDGSPSSTLTPLLVDGDDPVSGLPPGDTPIDENNPEPPIPPGGAIP